MAPPSTLFRFRITVDSKRPLIDIRVAMHPSETKIFLLTRVLAYALNYQDGIEFGPGLSDPDAPAIRILGGHGEILTWIDVGNPSARRLHKSAKAATSVIVYTYKDVERIKKEVQGEKVYNAHKIQLYAVDSDFLEMLSEGLERDNDWSITRNGNEIEITVEDEVYSTLMERHQLS